MSGSRHDIAIAGGGLAGGLVALALRRARPELDVMLIEQGKALGGHHRWSWFATDLDAAGTELMSGFRTARWDAGYDVRFPAYARTLSSPYRSLASTDFAAALQRELAPGSIRTGTAIADLDAAGVTLADGTRVAARAVIDARGFKVSSHLTGGWQLFMGRHLRTAVPHRLTRPIIMDATVPQPGAYRFVYVLPLAHDELFVEDTYYADQPALDRSLLSRRLDEYCAANGWTGDLLDHETGVLPVVTGGDYAAWQARDAVPGVTRVGTRAGLMHPLTSYSLPQAVETALLIAREADLPGEQLSARVAARAARHWRETWFYRQLGAMLFGAGKAEQRYRIFEHFYRMSEPRIERFYAARSGRADQLRVLCGKPPTPIFGALRALLASGVRLAEKDPA